MATSNTIGRVTAALFVMWLISTPSAFASWGVDGNPICTATAEQENAQVVSDGAGGAIIAWHDHRSGYSDIYVQRVDSLGAVKWDVDGLAVCTALNEQWNPMLVPDGAGGAVITWYDGRTLGYHIYVQRVDSLGAVKWDVDGLAVCTAADYRQPAEIVSDGAGGAILAWSDYRSGMAVVYAQRVDSVGAVKWTPDGVLICVAPAGDQRSPQLVSDGTGGAVIIWDDDRPGFPSVYAQRVDSLGAVKWDADGIAVCITDSYKGIPQLASDGASGAVVAWEDSLSGHLNIYSQRVDSMGVVKWAPGGVPMRSTTAEQRRPQIVTDGFEGAIVVWEDSLSGNWDIHAQRVDAAGVVQWTGDGVAVCSSAGDQQHPQLVSDGVDGALITWQDHRSAEYDIYAQYLGAGGELKWAVDGAWVCRASADQQYPQLASDGASGAIIAWEDLRGADSDIYAKRVTPDYTTALVFASASATVEAGGVTLSWQVNVDVPDWAFLVQRSDAPGGDFITLNVLIRKEGVTSFSCTDNSVLSGRTYWYQIVLAGPSGGELYGPIEVYVGTAPAVCRVYQSHPNPSNPVCTIRYELAKAGRVRLEIFDVRGSLVRILADCWREPGVYSELWDGRRGDGSALPSGVYLYRLEAGDFASTRKMVLLTDSR